MKSKKYTTIAVLEHRHRIMARLKTLAQAQFHFQDSSLTADNRITLLEILRQNYPDPSDHALLEYAARNCHSPIALNDKTPSGNTGLICEVPPNCHTGFSTKVDFFNGIATFETIQEAVEVAEQVAGKLNDEIEWEFGKPIIRGKTFESSGRSEYGIFIGLNPPSERTTGRAELWISIPGKPFGRVYLQDQVKLLKWLVDHGFRATRTDLALDDYGKTVKVEDVQAAIEKLCYDVIRSEPSLTRKKAGKPDQGFTYYFGSRQSAQMLRFYDKNAESKGEIDAHRWEGEFKDDIADQHFHALASLADEPDQGLLQVVSQYIAQTVNGLVRFSDRVIPGIDPNVKRKDARDSETLPFWEEFTKLCTGTIRLAPRVIKPSMKRKIDWIERQVSKAIAVLSIHLGDRFPAFLDRVKTLGMKKLDSSDARLLQISKWELQIYQRDYFDEFIDETCPELNQAIAAFLSIRMT